MKKAPEPGDELHPLMQGLQDLKYDPNENTPEELTLKYKADGDFYMKTKKFRMAIYSYDEALKANCKDNELIAKIYNNRSAANYFLKNYRYTKDKILLEFTLHCWFTSSPDHLLRMRKNV